MNRRAKSKAHSDSCDFAHSAPKPRSIRCNGEVLRYFREACGWAQIELAARSGLSRRVIVKAESGKFLDKQTLDMLVQTLQEAGARVSVDDLSSDPVSLACRFLKNYAAYRADCVQHCLNILSPDIVAVVDGDPTVNPIAGTYCGVAQFDGLWKKFFSIFDRAGGTLGESPEIECRGTEVMAWGHERIHIRGVPPTESGLVLVRFEFRDGKIIRFEDHYEVTGMMYALYHYADKFPDAEWAKVLRAKSFGLPQPLEPGPE